MIEIKTPARLHLGLLDTNGEQGRLYGSIGLAIQRPNVVLRATPGDRLQVDGLDTERVSAFARSFLEHYKLRPNAHLVLLENIPAHVGLGSGTQLALAVGTALANLNDLVLSTAEIAQVMGRGLNSGIGINTFQSGGFILDGGQSIRVQNQTVEGSELHRIPPALVHKPVPEDWRFVIIVPEVKAGLSGEKELNAFRTLPKAPSSQTARICWLVLMKLLPALVEQDIIEFGTAMTEIQRLVGQSFASIQGGEFANSLSEHLIGFLLQHGAAGAGQSSWGPTVYGLVSRESAARQLEVDAREYLSTLGTGQVFCVKPDNDGARILDL